MGRNRKYKGNRKRSYKRQLKQANTRAKYGPSMKPAPVIVKTADGGEEVVDQSKFCKERSIYSASERLEVLAKKSGFESYAAYINSKTWKDKRREALERDRWRCSSCECKIKLEVHHRHYPKRLGEEPLEWLEVLCSVCHDGQHKRRPKRKDPRRHLPAEEFFSVGNVHPNMPSHKWDGEMWRRV